MAEDKQRQGAEVEFLGLPRNEKESEEFAQDSSIFPVVNQPGQKSKPKGQCNK